MQAMPGDEEEAEKPVTSNVDEGHDHLQVLQSGIDWLLLTMGNQPGMHKCACRLIYFKV